jgi:hypothetical protein
MLGDLGHDIESSILGIIDMNYPKTGPITRMNVKGIIESDSTKRVIKPKMAYYAMQNVAAVFDHSLQRLKDLHPTFNSNPRLDTTTHRYAKNTDRSVSVYGYENASTKKQLYVIWNYEYIPTNSNNTRNVSFTFINGNFEQPVYVDMITGAVYDLPSDKWTKVGNKYSFKDVPVYDAPILIADKSLVRTR